MPPRVRSSRRPDYLTSLLHTSLTVPFLLCMFTERWNRLFFWFFLNTIILNLTGLSWKVMQLFRIPQRPNYHEYRRLSEECFLRGPLTLLNLLTFSKFALWYSNAEKSSILYTYHWIQGFVVLTLMTFTTLRAVYIVLKNPPYSPPSRQACIKAVYFFVSGYIVIFGMLGTGVKQFKREPPKSPYTFAEMAISCKNTTEFIPDCQGISENWTFYNRLLLLGALFGMILTLDRVSSSPIASDLNRRISRLRKLFYLAAAGYGCLSLPYAIFNYLMFFLSILRGKVFQCSNNPTLSYMYSILVLWLLVVGLLEAIVLLPNVLRRIWKEFANDLKYFASIMSIKVQYLTIKLQEKIGAEIDEKQRQKLQKLELQARISPLTGFDFKLAPQYLIEEEDCSICLEELCNPKLKLVYWRSCLHFYHENCLKLWTKNHSQCPMCMQQM